MTGAFLPNPKFASEAAASDEVREGLAEVAQEIAQAADRNARAIGAPWMPRRGHDLVEVEDDGENVWVTIAGDYGAHLYEYGSAKSPVHAPLRRAAMSAGLEVEETVED